MRIQSRKITRVLGLCTVGLASLIVGASTHAAPCVSSEPVESINCHPEESESYDCPDAQNGRCVVAVVRPSPLRMPGGANPRAPRGRRTGCGEDFEGTIEHANNIGSCLC